MKELNEHEGHFVISELWENMEIINTVSYVYITDSCCTCCPRQIRGPALEGKKMYGFGVRYLCNLSSRNRSGSNSWAFKQSINQSHVYFYNSMRTDHQAPKDPYDDASWIPSMWLCRLHNYIYRQKAIRIEICILTVSSEERKMACLLVCTASKL